MKVIVNNRRLLVSTAIAATALAGTPAWAQEGGLEEIVVTAQKREQSLQDVPIAVTAVTAETIQANRIFSVNDLSAIAPGVTVKPSPGGSSVPVFTIRGQSSFGVVPGSDKQVSIYIDGVYVGSPRGSIFELPDIQRLEVLRGPQGTLFGRNATAGAISITTRDPSGEAHVKVEGTMGNRDAYRFRMTADLPQMGPFSAFGSFVKNYRHGEVRNRAAGTVWDRTGTYGVQRSPKYLGTVDSESYFGAIKFEPSDTFKMVYKFDRNDDRGTPDVTGLVGYDPTFSGLPAASRPLLAPILTALYTSQPIYAAPDGKRPDEATNGFAVERTQKVFGHSLTSTWQASDSITIKNVAAYRQSEVFGPTPIDGISSLTFTQQALAPFVNLSVASIPNFFTLPQAQQDAIRAATTTALQPRVGQRIMLVGAQSASVSKQWSDELQLNYSSDKLNATVGALWFHSKDVAGGPDGQQNTLSFPTFIPQSGIIPPGNEGRYFNKATSLAAYAQLEYKLTPELEVVGGARITHDKKSSSFLYNTRDATTGVVSPDTIITPPNFKKTKPNFLIGLNWTPNDDTLIYGKFSNSFVTGGSTGGIAYKPETAKSFELGIKADFFDNKLRTNLAVFHVDYKNFQQSQSTSATPSLALAIAALTPIYGAADAAIIAPKLSTFVGNQGDVRARGFELEVQAAPTRGLTLGGSLSFTDISYPYIDPVVLAANGGRLDVAARPEWTGSANITYDTPALFGETFLRVRGDTFYQSGMQMSSNEARDIGAFNIGSARVGGYFTFNSRIALKNLKIGPLDTELAVWGKNLSNRRDITTALYTPFATSASYVPARTYGVDLTVEF